MIRSAVTRGFSNGVFSPGVALVVTRGYAIGEAQLQIIGSLSVGRIDIGPSINVGKVKAAPSRLRVGEVSVK